VTSPSITSRITVTASSMDKDSPAVAAKMASRIIWHHKKGKVDTKL
jgi:hypothetical protein